MQNNTALSYNTKVTFKTETGASKGFYLFNEWIKKAKTQTLLQKEGENGDYSISCLKYSNNELFFIFNVEGITKEHLIWQLTNIKSFCKTLNKFNSFTANGFVGFTDLTI